MNNTLTEFYKDWSARLNHLETSRHALFAVHVGVIGYLSKETIKPESLLMQDSNYSVTWISITFFLLYCFGALARNLFLKMMLVATQLMRIEYLVGIVDHELGYYSGRASKDKKRNDFVLLGYAPDIFTLGYFLLLLGVLSMNGVWLGVFGAAVAVAASVARAKFTYSKIISAICEKDTEEEKMKQNRANKSIEDNDLGCA